jgi:hypothetical protein
MARKWATDFGGWWVADNAHLRLDLRLHHRQNGFVQRAANLHQAFRHHRDTIHLETLGVLADRRHKGMVGGHQAEATRGDLVDALLAQVVCRVTRELARELVRKRRVVLLQGQFGVRVHLGQRNGGERLAGLRVGAVVHAADAHAERHGEVALLRAERHLVQDNRLQVALLLRGALEVDKFALLENGLGGLRRRRAPCGARLLQAQVGERGADVDHDGTLERVVGVGGVELVGLREVLLVANAVAGEGELGAGRGRGHELAVGRLLRGGAHHVLRDQQGLLHAG